MALVTGGSRGIGETIVLAFAKAGANVAFTYLSSEEKSKLFAETARRGCRSRNVSIWCFSICWEWNSDTKVVERFGRIDILVNNAGILGIRLTVAHVWKSMGWCHQYQSKVSFNLTKHVLKPMIKRSGSIINLSSVIAVFGNAGQTNYAASKAGIIGFTKSIAKKWVHVTSDAMP